MDNTEPADPDPRGDQEAVSDKSLLHRFQRGQSDAATRLYFRYADRLQALAASQSSPDLARKVDSEEIVQSVFRTFFRRAAQGQYSVPEGEELWKLLLVIALNKVRAAGAYHRAAKRDVRLTAGGAAFDRAIDGEAVRDDQSLAVLKLVVDELLDALPPLHRQMAMLRIEGFEVAQIATKVQRSKRSVERVLEDFRKRLDSLIGEER